MKFRPEADIWPLMEPAALKDLAADIDEQGQVNPIYTFKGAILDGRNRWLAITKHCKIVKDPRTEEAKTDSPIAFVISQNEKRRHLTTGQRAHAAAKALPFFEAESQKRMISGRSAGGKKGGKIAGRSRPKVESPDRVVAQKSHHPIPAVETTRRATAEAAKAFGSSDASVKRARKVVEEGSKKVNEAVVSGALSIGKAEQIVKESKDEKEQDRRVAAAARSKNATRVKGLTGEVEWYTPRQYLDAEIEVMGSIDLDPASSKVAQKHVKAKRCFTIEDDGLTQAWKGSTFLNPPYAAPACGNFVTKLVEEVRAGRVEQAILLTNNATDTGWWHEALAACAAVCFTRGRIAFLEAVDGEVSERKGGTHGQTFFYFGPNLNRFAKVFGAFGSVATPLRG